MTQPGELALGRPRSRIPVLGIHRLCLLSPVRQFQRQSFPSSLTSNQYRANTRRNELLSGSQTRRQPLIRNTPRMARSSRHFAAAASVSLLAVFALLFLLSPALQVSAAVICSDNVIPTLGNDTSVGRRDCFGPGPSAPETPVRGGILLIGQLISSSSLFPLPRWCKTARLCALRTDSFGARRRVFIYIRGQQCDGQLGNLGAERARSWPKRHFFSVG